MQRTLALLHTTAMTVPDMKELAARELADVRTINVLDDSLLADIIRAGGVTEPAERRIRGLLTQAAWAGAEAVLSCCSSVGDVVDRLADSTSVPVWRIDEAAATEAAARGRHVGILATVRTTLAPTARLVKRKLAASGGAEGLVEALLVDGAYQALHQGRLEEHDTLVRSALFSLASRCDVVLLAQASMARIVATLEPAPAVPVLTTPVSGLRLAANRLELSAA